MRLRIEITLPEPGETTSKETYSFGDGWRKMKMPSPRVSHSMVLMPNGHVTLINGAQVRFGSAGAGWVGDGCPRVYACMVITTAVLTIDTNLLWEPICGAMFNFKLWFQSNDTMQESAVCCVPDLS